MLNFVHMMVWDLYCICVFVFVHMIGSDVYCICARDVCAVSL